MPDPEDDLRALLGAEPPPSVRAADEGQLTEILRAARKRQAKTLEDAFTATLKHVPFPVRGIVKKVLLG
jgi:hypothetical protein